MTLSSARRSIAARRRGSIPVSGVGELQGRSRHGLSPSAIDAMARGQLRACSICGDPLPAAPEVDHDHAMARMHPHPEDMGCPRCIRGLLCGKCNLMLGNARDRVDVLAGGIAYLRAWEARNVRE